MFTYNFFGELGMGELLAWFSSDCRCQSGGLLTLSSLASSGLHLFSCGFRNWKLGVHLSPNIWSPGDRECSTWSKSISKLSEVGSTVFLSGKENPSLLIPEDDAAAAAEGC